MALNALTIGLYERDWSDCTQSPRRIAVRGPYPVTPEAGPNGAPKDRPTPETLRKVAIAHRLSWKGRLGRIAGTLDGILPTREEEELVLPNWAADRAAELIALQRRAEPRGSWFGAGEGGVPGVEHEIPHVFKGVAVKLIRAGLRDRVDRSRRMRAILSRQRTGLHLEFLNGIREWERKILIAQRIVVRAAIEPIGHAALRATCD